MHPIPLIAIVVPGLVAVVWNPIFAPGVFVLLMVGFVAFVGLRSRSDPRADARQRLPRPQPAPGGAWGERGTS